MNVIAGLAVNIEIFLFIAALYAIHVQIYHRKALSLVYSIAITLAFYSAVIQIFFYFEIIRYYFLVDIFVFLFSITTIMVNYDHLLSLVKSTFFVIRSNGTIYWIFFLFCIYLGAQSFLMPVTNSDSFIYNLSRVLLYQEEGTTFIKNYMGLHQVNLQWGWDILHYLILRFYSDFGLGIISFLCYLLLILSSYCIVKERYGDSKVSFQSSFIISALMEIVLQSTSTKNDLPAASVASVIILSLYLYYRKKQRNSLPLAVLFSIFGITIKGYFAGFVFVLFLCFFLLVVFENGIAGILKSPYSILTLAVLVCLAGYSAYNYVNFGHVYGDPDFIAKHRQQYGLYGMFVNLGRYITISINLPIELGGIYLSNLANELIEHTRIAMETGWANFYAVPITADEDLAGFGPVLPLFVLPAILFSLIRGRGFVRMTAAVLILYTLLLAYSIVWSAPINRYFSIIFANSALLVAFFITHLNRKKIGLVYKNIVITISVLVFAYAAFFNVRKLVYLPKPVINYALSMVPTRGMSEKQLDEITRPWTYYVVNRNGYMNWHYKNDHFIDNLVNHIPENAMVLNLGLYPLALDINLPDHEIVSSRPQKIYYENRYLNFLDKNDFQILKRNFDYVIISTDAETFSISELLDFHRENLELVYPTEFVGEDHILLYRFRA